MMGPKLREETAHMVGVRELKIAFREVRPWGHRGPGDTTGTGSPRVWGHCGHGDTPGINGHGECHGMQGTAGMQGTMTTGRAGAGPSPGCLGGLWGGDPICGRRSST